jgi:hypothetical protein
MARDVGFEPTWPFDHRLSRPAPYQAWGIPHKQRSGLTPKLTLLSCSTEHQSS